jgi:hypothetical protein
MVRKGYLLLAEVIGWIWFYLASVLREEMSASYSRCVRLAYSRLEGNKYEGYIFLSEMMQLGAKTPHAITTPR